MEGNERAEIIRRAGSHRITTASQRSTTYNEACWRVSSGRRPWCLSCISLSSAAQPTQSARRSSTSTRGPSSCRRSNPKGRRANSTPGATSSAEACSHCSEDGPATSSSSHSAPATSKEHANSTASGESKPTAMPVRVQVPKTVLVVGRLHHHLPQSEVRGWCHLHHHSDANASCCDQNLSLWGQVSKTVLAVGRLHHHPP
jgi:hypothetical protein